MCCGPSCVFINLCVRKQLQVLKEVFALLMNGKVPLFRFPENEKRSPKKSEILCRFSVTG